MSNFNLSESELLKTVLQPLLEDFQYWFAEARPLLEQEEINFLGPENQTNLLERVKRAQQEVSAAKSLFKVTNGQAGVETSILMTWHQLVAEYWQVMNQFRLRKSSKNKPES